MADRVPFRLRAKEVSRVEAFSDIVFGFALTIIVISLEVPKTFTELMEELGGLLGFGICFAILMWIWYEHHTYFRRYAFTDGLTIALNSALLFLVLFYVYPMKFIFSLATGHLHNPGRGDAGQLYLIYALGFSGIFALFFLLYVHAWRRREQLALNIVELHDTKTSMIMSGAYVAIGLAAATIALSAKSNAVHFAGWIYFLLGPASAIIGATRGRKREDVETSYLASTGGASTSPTASQTTGTHTPSPA